MALCVPSVYVEVDGEQHSWLAIASLQNERKGEREACVMRKVKTNGAGQVPWNVEKLKSLCATLAETIALICGLDGR